VFDVACNAATSLHPSRTPHAFCSTTWDPTVNLWSRARRQCCECVCVCVCMCVCVWMCECVCAFLKHCVLNMLMQTLHCYSGTEELHTLSSYTWKFSNFPVPIAQGHCCFTTCEPPWSYASAAGIAIFFMPFYIQQYSFLLQQVNNQLVHDFLSQQNNRLFLSLWIYLWLAETSQQPISQTTWLKVTPHGNHCNHLHTASTWPQQGHKVMYIPWKKEHKGYTGSQKRTNCWMRSSKMHSGGVDDSFGAAYRLVPPLWTLPTQKKEINGIFVPSSLGWTTIQQRGLGLQRNRMSSKAFAFLCSPPHAASLFIAGTSRFGSKGCLVKCMELLRVPALRQCGT